MSVRRALRRREERVELVGLARSRCSGHARRSRHGRCSGQRGDHRRCGGAVVLPVGVIRALTGRGIVRHRGGHGRERRSGSTPLISSLANAIETAGSLARTLEALDLTGTSRERRVLAQVDESGAGGAVQPGTPVVDHRIRGE